MIKKGSKYKKNLRGTGVEGDLREGKAALKNSGLFHELTKAIKGLINFPLDTRSLSNRQWSEANGGCHKSAHVRGGPCISCNS